MIRPILNQRGFSLIEVMVSMVILAFSVLGVTSMFQYANEGLLDGTKGTLALAMAEARVEVKRGAPWDALLIDDLDADGVAEIQMRDDGMHGDVMSGDGIYSGLFEQDGVRLVWTIQSLQSSPLESTEMVLIKALATYQIGAQSRSIETGTLRVNPAFVGLH
ncbi:MAG TPA: prepilin-type N-terminal cleavage/methylation domain-containing protein [Nitrospiraceae bacterium]|nr:prepilin-type N-terminal cleavage/methylation domain-containing protein [Nitrospiraceae bacterium]